MPIYAIQEQVVDFCFCSFSHRFSPWHPDANIIDAGTLIVVYSVFPSHQVNSWFLLIVFLSAGCNPGHLGTVVWLLFLCIFCTGWVAFLHETLGVIVMPHGVSSFLQVHWFAVFAFCCAIWLTDTFIYFPFCWVQSLPIWPSVSRRLIVVFSYFVAKLAFGPGVCCLHWYADCFIFHFCCTTPGYWWFFFLLLFLSCGCTLGHPGAGIWLMFLLIFCPVLSCSQ